MITIILLLLDEQYRMYGVLTLCTDGVDSVSDCVECVLTVCTDGVECVDSVYRRCGKRHT